MSPGFQRAVEPSLEGDYLKPFFLLHYLRYL
jgi:hypothetical protein